MLFLGLIAEGGLQMKAIPQFSTFVVLTALLSAPASLAQRVIYVDTDAVGANDGSSWANAFVFLQDAFGVAQDGDEVWVAEGVYRPDRGQTYASGDRHAKFTPRQGVALYGGFEGVELMRAQRNWQGHPTVLSGDLADDDDALPVLHSTRRHDNSYSIIEFSGDDRATATSVVSGITVTGAQGDLPTSVSYALHILGSCRVDNSIIVHNYSQSGSAVGVSQGPDDNCRITDSVFTDNHSGLNGGAVTAKGEIEFRRVSFQSNGAVGRGGAVELDSRGTEQGILIVESLFLDNHAEYGGALALGSESALDVTASGFFGNSGVCENGAAYFTEGSAVRIDNSVFSGNRTVEPPGGCWVWSGGGAFSAYQVDLYLSNSTFSGNTSVRPGQSLYLIEGSATISNSILWGDDASGTQGQIVASSASVSIVNSILDGAFLATVSDQGGNLDAPPRLIDPDGRDEKVGTLDDDLGLRPDSPAIDAGRNEFLASDWADQDEDGDRLEVVPFDYTRRWRIWSLPPRTPLVDIGAFEYGSSFTSSQGPQLHTRTAECRGLSAFPSPFHDRLTIEGLGSVGPGAVAVELFDVTGRRVWTQSVSELENAFQLSATGLGAGFVLIRLSSASRACSFATMRL